MRGLLEKDFCLLKSSRQTMVLFFLLAVVLGMGRTDTFILGYLPFFMVVLLTGTISYDEVDHGFSFLFTLPVGRKTYIREKYVFCMAGTSLTLAVAGILYFLIKKVHGIAIHPAEDAALFPVFLAIIFFALSVMIPVQVKYGIEQARIMIAGICFVMAGCILFVQKIGDGAAMEKVFAWMNQIHPAMGAAGSLALSLIFVAISYKISIRIMQNKEF